MDIRSKNQKKGHIYCFVLGILLGLAVYIGAKGNMSNQSDLVKAASKPIYEIKNHVLIKYNGKQTTVTIPSSVKKIGDGAFENNKFVMEVIIPETVVSMGNDVFRKCINLEKITLPDSLKEMGTGCFVGCEGLNTIAWSENLLEIPDFTFMNSGIEQFEFTETNIEKIGESAFEGSQIRKVWMPDTVKELGYKTFARCYQLKDIRLSNKLKELPSGFCSGSPIIVINIPDSVQIINEMAFAQCKNLNNIMGGENVKEIKAMAFYETKWYGQKEQPLQIGFVYVKDSGLLERVILPEDILMIYDEAFHDNLLLKEVVLPSQLRIIGDKAFYRCKNLKKVEFGNELREIRMDAFRNCISLEEVKFPESLESIEDTAFANCRSLNTYQFPKGEIAFGEDVFYGVEQGNAGEFNQFIIANDNILVAYIDTAKEEELKIPDGVKKIGENAFNLSHMIEKLYIPGTVKVIEKGSFEYAEIQTIVLEEGVKEIKKDSFYHCYTNTIVIPDSVEKIGSLKIASNSLSPLTVVCSKDSFAYNYAKKNNITVKIQ